MRLRSEMEVIPSLCGESWELGYINFINHLQSSLIVNCFLQNLLLPLQLLDSWIWCESWWMCLRLQLGVPKYTMEGICCQYAMFGKDVCVMELLSIWLHSHAEKPTWEWT